MTVADRIKFRREELNITQEELAKRLGLKGKSSVCKIESSGDNISTKSIRKYAKALDVTIAYLMGWEQLTLFDDVLSPNQSTMDLEHIISVNNENGGQSKFAEFLYNTTVIKTTRSNITDEELSIIDKFRLADDSTKDVIVRLLAFAAEQDNK